MKDPEAPQGYNTHDSQTHWPSQPLSNSIPYPYPLYSKGIVMMTIHSRLVKYATYCLALGALCGACAAPVETEVAESELQSRVTNTLIATDGTPIQISYDSKRKDGNSGGGYTLTASTIRVEVKTKNSNPYIDVRIDHICKGQYSPETRTRLALTKTPNTGTFLGKDSVDFRTTGMYGGNIDCRNELRAGIQGQPFRDSFDNKDFFNFQFVEKK
jgi:hypothetical protein